MPRLQPLSYFAVVFLFSTALSSQAAHGQSDEPDAEADPRLRIGLVLGGGGARGADKPSGCGPGPIAFGETAFTIEVPPSDRVAGTVPTNAHGSGLGFVAG